MSRGGEGHRATAWRRAGAACGGRPRGGRAEGGGGWARDRHRRSWARRG